MPYKAQLDDNVRFETIHLMRADHTLLNARCGTPFEREALVADAVGSRSHARATSKFAAN
ncbi:MAG: hypothetical protein CPDRYMAC_1555 [uncultured Paraburkholderia sp.]|nr:MAG: hypothetical protein CPDRYDRY_1459 [uncultured Paraburkholderia sp.]CAH2919079.1 MAG: hypothetical protein CPDRYMAC_1555 [uncultured Paraburkholderia sp.]